MHDALVAMRPRAARPRQLRRRGSATPRCGARSGDAGRRGVVRWTPPWPSSTATRARRWSSTPSPRGCRRCGAMAGDASMAAEFAAAYDDARRRAWPRSATWSTRSRPADGSPPPRWTTTATPRTARSSPAAPSSPARPASRGTSPCCPARCPRPWVATSAGCPRGPPGSSTRSRGSSGPTPTPPGCARPPPPGAQRRTRWPTCRRTAPRRSAPSACSAPPSSRSPSRSPPAWPPAAAPSPTSAPSLARACDAYADHVDDQREEILDLVHDLLRDAVIIEGIGIVLGAFTAGTTTAGATAFNAARIAAAAPRLLRVIAALRTLASTCAAPLRWPPRRCATYVAELAVFRPGGSRSRRRTRRSGGPGRTARGLVMSNPGSSTPTTCAAVEGRRRVAVQGLAGAGQHQRVRGSCTRIPFARVVRSGSWTDIRRLLGRTRSRRVRTPSCRRNGPRHQDPAAREPGPVSAEIVAGLLDEISRRVLGAYDYLPLYHDSAGISTTEPRTRRGEDRARCADERYEECPPRRTPSGVVRLASGRPSAAAVPAEPGTPLDFDLDTRRRDRRPIQVLVPDIRP